MSFDIIKSICFKEKSKNPYEIFTKIVNMDFCPMHGPIHHFIVGACLLTAYKNAGGNIDLDNALDEMHSRSMKVPGGACGNWGACGAGISTGMFISIITDSTPLSKDTWGHCNMMTSKSLFSLGKIGGPRCCKRNSSISIIEAVNYVKENFNIHMQISNIKCDKSNINNQCIKERCPFFNTTV